VSTAGPASKLALQADRPTIKADGQDLSYITLTVADNSGRLVPRSKNPISFSVTGPAEIIATDNGDATSFEPFQSSEHSAFNGLCLAIVRSKPEAGNIVVRATSLGLQAAEVKLRSK
jgi:beta-galactosidase